VTCAVAAPGAPLPRRLDGTEALFHIAFTAQVAVRAQLGEKDAMPESGNSTASFPAVAAIVA
jgi:hypothetical protein